MFRLASSKFPVSLLPLKRLAAGCVDGLPTSTMLLHLIVSSSFFFTQMYVFLSLISMFMPRKLCLLLRDTVNSPKCF